MYLYGTSFEVEVDHELLYWYRMQQALEGSAGQGVETKVKAASIQL